MLTTEERVDQLEVIFARFVAQAEKDREEARQERREQARRLDAFREQGEKDRAEARQERRELARQLGDISKRMGTVVEDMITPSLRRIARGELGCGEEILFGPRIVKTRPDGSGRRREFEALYIGEKAVMLNESKTTARPEYAKEFVEFLRSGEFSQYFPEYADKPVAPVFSSLYVPDDIVTYLTKQGVYAVGMGDETMQVLNREQVATSRAP
ncbi:MAG: hypothetical protein HY023_07335 [Chloroflexi bacterium]|nr:hypothetical protein [Chloroflexota bacterium]MBI3763267.1 hypothetical protein [Chloroflexota bacterium]